jgi:hypothetical protein
VATSRLPPGRRVQRVSAVLWPSFLAARTATAVFFTFFDPLELFECEGEPPWSRIAAYSVAFFLFWALCAASSALSVYFATSPAGARAGAEHRREGVNERGSEE